MYKIIVSLALIIYSLNGFAQQRDADSLINLLKTAKADTTKAWLQLRTGRTLRDVNLAAAHKYIDSGFALSQQLNFKAGILQSVIQKAGLFRAEGNNDSVLTYNKKLLQYAQEFDDKKYIGIGYVNLSESYNDFSDSENALAYALKGLEIVEKNGTEGVKEDTYALLLRLYFDRHELDKALVYGEKALAIARKLEAPEREALTLINMAMIYSKQKEYDKALSTTNRFMEICKSVQNERFLAYGYSNLADIYLKQNKIELSRKNSELGVELAIKTGDKSMEATALRGLALAELLSKNYAQSKIYADSSIAIHKALNNPENIIHTTKLLANLAYATSDPAKGYAYELESDEFQENYVRSVLSKQSSDLEKKYETEKKEAEIQLQKATIKQKNTLNYILIGSAAALLIILLLSYRNYKHRQKLQQQRINELETEKQLTATAAVLKGEEQERTRLAKDLHDGLGGMLSGIKHSLNNMKGNLIMTPENAQAFERSIDMLDSSIKEMRRVAHNMMPEALLKFGLDTALRDFCNDINQSGALNVTYQSIDIANTTINQTTAITIYRVVQELLNNSIKHATATHALVQLSKQDNKISVTVEDDGSGFNVKQLALAQGIGWRNIQSRIEYLKGSLDVQSEPGKGTSVFIELELD